MHKVLLIGGTSETYPVAKLLLEKCSSILVSTATDEPLQLPQNPTVKRRCGRLTESEFTNLLHEQGITLVIDAAHPYAEAVHLTVLAAARSAGIPLIRFERQQIPEDYGNAAVVFVQDHLSAAEKAFSYGKPVLVTTGSNNIEPYVRAAREADVKILARVLPREESILKAKKAGLNDAEIIAEKGPFTRVHNEKMIKKHTIGIVVTKESGLEGGIVEKIEAAQACGCIIVFVQRPPVDYTGALVVSTIEQLRNAI
jgi:precorrin-6A/cobalt-precorrin-6A reductase